MTRYLAIAIGGAIGALLRYAVGNWVATQTAISFPLGTFIINVTGCFIIGFFLTLISERISVDPHWRLAIAVGFVGAYTTFSTFEYEVLKLIEAKNITASFLYIIASLMIGFLAVWGGALAARAIGMKTAGNANIVKTAATINQSDEANNKSD